MSSVSVIIPTFNRAGYLSQAVQSALGQPYLEPEVIVVDDGSTDNTAEVIHKINDSRLRYIYQENKGKGAAINLGFLHSRGDFIGKLDSDDWYALGAIPLLAEYLEQNPRTGVAAGGYWIVDHNGKLLKEVRPWMKSPNLDLATWAKGCPLLWQGALVRREWFEKVGGFDVNIQGQDDWDFGLRLATNSCPMLWMHQIIFNYRVHSSNSIKNADVFATDSATILDRFFNSSYLPEGILAEKDAAYRQAHITNASRFYAAAQFDKAKSEFSKVIQADKKLGRSSSGFIWFNIAYWGLSPLLTENPRQFIHSVTRNLPSEAEKFWFPERRVLAELAAISFSQDRQKNNRKKLWKLAFEIFLYYPPRVFDRGIFSVLIESLIGKKVTDFLRRIF